MTSSSSKIEREVIDTYRASNRVRVDAVEERRMGETHRYLEVYRMSTERYRSIVTGEPGEQPIREQIARIPAGRGYDVLCGLAEAYGCEVRGK